MLVYSVCQLFVDSKIDDMVSSSAINVPFLVLIRSIKYDSLRFSASFVVKTALGSTQDATDSFLFVYKYRSSDISLRYFFLRSKTRCSFDVVDECQLKL